MTISETSSRTNPISPDPFIWEVDSFIEEKQESAKSTAKKTEEVARSNLKREYKEFQSFRRRFLWDMVGQPFLLAGVAAIGGGAAAPFLVPLALGGGVVVAGLMRKDDFQKLHKNNPYLDPDKNPSYDIYEKNYRRSEERIAAERRREYTSFYDMG